MSNFERDMANTMLDAADARIASLEADKADLLRVLSIADEKIRSGEDARGQYIRENAALEARCRELEAALRECKPQLYSPHSETHALITRLIGSEKETSVKSKEKSEAMSEAEVIIGPGAPPTERYQFPAKCCKCGKVDWKDAPVLGIYFCSYACT